MSRDAAILFLLEMDWRMYCESALTERYRRLRHRRKRSIATEFDRNKTRVCESMMRRNEPSQRVTNRVARRSFGVTKFVVRSCFIVSGCPSLSTNWASCPTSQTTHSIQPFASENCDVQYCFEHCNRLLRL